MSYIRDWPVFVAECENRNVGFFALKNVNGENRFDHLWIEPSFIKKGIGKLLFYRAIEDAKQLKWGSFRLAADPYTLDFYLKLGCLKIGRVQSRIKPDLFLPHVEIKF